MQGEQDDLSWAWFRNKIVNIALAGAIFAGASGLGIAWANQTKIKQVESDVKTLEGESKETHDTVIRIEKDVEFITRGIHKIDKAVERLEERGSE